jgi:hypothetical protein
MEELTTSQAVKTYGVFPSVIHRMILMGRLDARRDERGFWHITKASLERWNTKRVRRNTVSARAHERGAVEARA